jgi:hypothetical protein
MSIVNATNVAKEVNRYEPVVTSSQITVAIGSHKVKLLRIITETEKIASVWLKVEESPEGKLNCLEISGSAKCTLVACMQAFDELNSKMRTTYGLGPENAGLSGNIINS